MCFKRYVIVASIGSARLNTVHHNSCLCALLSSAMRQARLVCRFEKKALILGSGTFVAAGSVLNVIADL